ncbi:DUF427 domain-containing protein [Vreelandella salicampi]|uniref:DUF427 domain-containing protein n=1 Tax=Vreelandella salicampi TaxID=1449798 RepID=A0A7Z0LIJ2_9GAMM|nr:DUF427 domain-containing protein [Halomonas salicampi]NYS59580.1 DUF427 domain-containing protein [Halomonas salicampi]
MPQAPRIELHPVNQRVQVHVDGKLIADSTQALELRETGCPPRHYFPREDVRMDLLTVTDTAIYFPFKDYTMCFCWVMFRMILEYEWLNDRSHVTLGREIPG